MATTHNALRAALAGQAGKHNGKAGCKSTTVYIPEWLHQFAAQDSRKTSSSSASGQPSRKTGIHRRTL